MNIAKRFFTFILIFALGLGAVTSIPVFAATTSNSETELTKELSLNMPDTTQDPNYPVTFIDPSKQGVDITVDGKTTTKAPSPFLLPNLSIGSHAIIFKFKGKDGLVKVLTRKVMIVPKAPVFDQTLKTIVIRPNQAAIKGTALPQATILIVVNSEKTYKVTSSTAGTWEFIVPDQRQGINNILAFTIKDGIVSEPSKAFSYQYKLQSDEVTAPNPTQPTSSFSIVEVLQTFMANINANKDSNPGLFYGVLSAALVLIFIVIYASLRNKAARNRDNKTIATLFGTLQKDGGTIVDVIQASKKIEEATVPHEVVSIKKKKGKKTKVVRVAPVVEPPTPAVEPAEKKGFNIFGLLKPKTEPTAETSTEQPKQEKSQKPEQTKKPEAEQEETIEPVIDVETEEPEKKVLTKEEFLKQFQKGSGQDE